MVSFSLPFSALAFNCSLRKLLRFILFSQDFYVSQQELPDTDLKLDSSHRCHRQSRKELCQHPESSSIPASRAVVHARAPATCADVVVLYPAQKQKGPPPLGWRSVHRNPCPFSRHLTLPWLHFEFTSTLGADPKTCALSHLFLRDEAFSKV